MRAVLRYRKTPWRPYALLDTLVPGALLTPSSRLTAANLFAGCGGSCLGYRMAGFRTLWASEFVPAAAEVYAANFPGVVLDRRDVRAVTVAEALSGMGLREGELDLLDGSPPCASFSMSGSRQAGCNRVKKYSDVRQRVDDLFFEFARLLEGIRPRAFVAENVKGLVQGAAKGYFKEIRARLIAAGYRVGARVLDASRLGVPQRRERVFLIGVREDLGAEPSFPFPLPWSYSIREACPEIGAFYLGRDALRRGPSIPGVKRLDASRPCTTIMAGGMGKPGHNVDGPANNTTQVAVLDRRGFLREVSILELKRLSGFPDDFALGGSRLHQWERLGRAVPPPVARAVGLAVRETLEEVDRCAG